MTDLLDDIVPVAPHPDVDMGLPPVDLDALERDWSEGNFDDPMDAVRNAQRNIPRLIAELRSYRSEHGTTSPNGRAHGAYKHVCAGCGREFDSNRRQLPGKRSWCGRPECKKLAAAERARDYRDRKATQPNQEEHMPIPKDELQRRLAAAVEAARKR